MSYVLKKNHKIQIKRLCLFNPFSLLLYFAKNILKRVFKIYTLRIFNFKIIIVLWSLNASYGTDVHILANATPFYRKVDADSL